MSFPWCMTGCSAYGGLAWMLPHRLMKSHDTQAITWHTPAHSDTVKPDAARPGSLMRRVESIAKPAGPATAWPGLLFGDQTQRREIIHAHSFSDDRRGRR